jgi:hypothetical protein
MNSPSAAQAPADRLQERRRLRPAGSFAVSDEARQTASEYSAAAARGEFDYAQLSRDIAAAN